MTRQIIIDCDPGVDDALALLLAFAAPDALDVLGVTTVAGNVPVELTATNARRICELAGLADMPVYAGCERPLRRKLATAEYVHGDGGLAGVALSPPQMPLRRGHAVDFIVDTVMSAPGEVTLCPTGPLTNIAAALNRAPALAGMVDEIVLMGGAVGPGNVTPSAEFNIYVDPHAAEIVFASGAPITMIGLDVTHQALVTPERRAALAATGGRIGNAVAGLMEAYSENLADRFGGKGAPLHDPCVIGYLLRPDLFEGRPAHVAIETTSEATIGRTAVEFSTGGTVTPNATVIESIDSTGFFALLTERLTALAGGAK